MMKKLSRICANANRLVKQGYTRSEAFKMAWRLSKLPDITAKVKGVTFGQRQTALEHLTRYAPELVSFRLAADTQNAYDPSAVGVIVTVKEKGSYLIGYLARELAADISPMLQAGIGLVTSGAVVGGYEPYMNYGARITVNFA